jgi:hypothetical protein
MILFVAGNREMGVPSVNGEMGVPGLATVAALALLKRLSRSCWLVPLAEDWLWREDARASGSSCGADGGPRLGCRVGRGDLVGGGSIERGEADGSGVFTDGAGDFALSSVRSLSFC